VDVPETTTQTIAEFLLARIAEDASRANSVTVLTSTAGETLGRIDDPRIHLSADNITTMNATIDQRGVREAEAKRRIVNLDIDADGEITHRVVLHILASVYADHPDYRQEWRP